MACRSRILVLASLTLAACSAPPRTASVDSALGESLESSAAAYVLDSGHNPCDEYQDSVWIDLSIRNDAYDKRVGVVWTADGWRTTNVSDAHYKGALPDGRERWGVDLYCAAGRFYGQGEVEYAGFATMNGQTSWSLFRNHYIYNRVTPAQPLLVLQAAGVLDASGAPSVQGVVRALNVPSSRRVFVRYTLDDWKSFAEVEARYSGPDFGFSFPVAGDAKAIEEAAFAIRLEANGETVWENNGGQNHHVQLAPRLASASWNAPPHASAGPKMLTGGLDTSLPIARVVVQLDDGTRLDLPPVQSGNSGGFAATGSFSVAIATDSLSDGVHGATIEATAGPFVRSFAGPTFIVDHGIGALGGTAIAKGATPWDFARADDGHTLVVTDTNVLDYAALDAQPKVFEAAATGFGVSELALDGAGRVYVLGATRLTRWHDDGTLDRGFGSGGTLELDATWGGTPLCYSSDVAADPSGFFVVDSCNARLLRFDVNGAFVDQLPLATVGLTFALRVLRSGGTLWLSGSTFSDGASHWQLLEVATPGGAPMSIRAAHPVGGDVEFFAPARDGFWTTYGSNLYHLDTNGMRTAAWTGLGNDVTSLPGNLGIARRVLVDGDGSVTVLSVEGGHLERFALTPQSTRNR